jgi:hypothetical protein
MFYDWLHQPINEHAMTMTDAPGAADARKIPQNHAPSEVRIAGPEEEADIMAMCFELWRENGLFSYSEAKVRAILRRSFERKGGMVAVVGPPGKLEAMICLLIDQYYYTDDWNLNEVWNYVRPAYRRSQHAKTMVQWAKGMADHLKLRLFIGVVSNERTEAKIRMYRRVFGEPAGGYFVYTPKVLYSSGQAAGTASSH